MTKPTEQCRYFHTWDCGRRDACPTPCSRFDFYGDFHKDESDTDTSEQMAHTEITEGRVLHEG